MPNPRTIEELIKMKPCPFKDGQKITGEDYECFRNNYPAISSELGLAVYEASLGYEIGETFKMPDGYYLPPDKRLGLPLGLWLMKTIRELCNQLPYGVVAQYFYNTDFALSGSWRAWHPSDFREDNAIIDIRKQPPNLYNPLDYKAKEVPTVEVPVEPVMVSVQEFARNPVGKWFTVKGKTYYEYTKKHSNDDQTKHIVEIVSAGHPIYASDPTAWLASQAEQEAWDAVAGVEVYKGVE